MYAIVRTSVNGINDDLSLNVTEQDVIKTFESKDSPQKYLRQLEHRTPSRFSIRGLSKNEFRAIRTDGSYFLFQIRKRTNH